MSESSQSLRLDGIEDVRALLEAIFEHSPVAYQVYRADGRSLFVNRAFVELFKVAPPPEYNVLEDDVLERQGFLAVVRRAFAGETIKMPPIWYDPRELEQIQVREGRRVGIQVTLFPLRGKKGVIEHIAVCARDVTAELERERERDEFALTAHALRATTEALQRRERELETTLSSIGDAVVATDTEGRVVRMNAVAEKLTGWPASEAKGRSLADIFRIVNEDTHESLESPVERVLREGTIVGLANHTALIARDGSARAIADSGAPIRDQEGRLRGVVLVFRDETENRRADRKLRESEERFRVTFEQSAVGIAHVAPDGQWVEVNRRLCDILGYSRDELLAGRFQDITHPDDLEENLRLMRSVLAGEAPTYSMEKRYVRKDGTPVWAEITVALLRDEAFAPKYFITVVQDIASRKRAEAELIEASAQLRQAQKMEAIGRLAGGIAHDFNNLLSVILGHSALLLETPQADETLSEGLGQVQQAGERAAALTQQLLAFSRQQVLEPRKIDLNEIVSNVERMMQRLIGEHIRFQTKRASGRSSVHVDASQIEQIVVNLVVNARDAMPNGGTLTIETERVELDETHAAVRSGLKPGSYVMLAVSDTGVGMDRATQDRVFEPFFTTKPMSKGTGLGLSTVFGIVKQHGGHIELRSEPGHGTTFTIYLPRVERTSIAPGPLPKALAAGGSETVLLVEDEAAVRAVILSILRRAGYDVLVASTGLEALEQSRRHAGRIHLLLTDVVMPTMSGPALAAELATHRSDMAILYMSGYTDDAIVHHGDLIQGRAFLQKPITPEALTRKIREVLG